AHATSPRGHRFVGGVASTIAATPPTARATERAMPWPVVTAASAPAATQSCTHLRSYSHRVRPASSTPPSGMPLARASEHASSRIEMHRSARDEMRDVHGRYRFLPGHMVEIYGRSKVRSELQARLTVKLALVLNDKRARTCAPRQVIHAASN